MNIMNWSMKKKIKACIKLILAGSSIRLTLGSQKRVFLIGTPIHDNLGDHLLALAEIDTLKENYKDYELIEVSTEQYMLNKARILKSLNPEDKVFLTGGGWLGDIWPSDEMIARDVVETLGKYDGVTIMPQTIFYKDKNGNFVQSARKFWSGQNALLCVRDKDSEIFAVNNLGISSEKCFLLPDMGFAFNITDELEVSGDQSLLLCLREDRESLLSDSDRNKLTESAQKSFDKISYTSTLGDRVISPAHRDKQVRAKISEFAKSNLVITDRLHGAIFAILSGTPCIALNNVTGKVSGVLGEWCRGYSGVIFVDDPEHLIQHLSSIYESFPSREEIRLDRARLLKENKQILDAFIKEHVNA